MTARIDIPLDRVEDFCRRWKIVEFSFFGSVLREDFRPDSDIDVLVSFDLEAKWTLFDIVDMQDELAALFGRKVDLVEKDAMRNPFRRHEILKTAETIYAAR